MNTKYTAHPNTYANIHTIRKMIANAKDIAREKGIEIEKNVLIAGWTIIFPDNMEKHHCQTPKDLFNAVNDFQKGEG